MSYGDTPSTVAGPGLPEEESPNLWRELTERVELPQESQDFKGLGEIQVLKVERLGVLAEAQIHIVVKAKVKEAAKFGPGMPDALLKKLQLEVNGVAGVMSVSGPTLRCRQCAVYRTPTRALEEGKVEPGHEYAVGTELTFAFVVQVPIAEDLRELEGAALAQSEETTLGIQLAWATAADMLESGSLEEVSGTIKWGITWFTIGTASTKKGQKVLVLPDLQSLHGIVERSDNINGSGEQSAPLTRASGDLLRYYLSAFSGQHAQYDPTAWIYYQLMYGGNQRPVNYMDPVLLVERNARDYRERPDINGIYYALLDTTLDDAVRDAIRPMGLSELKSVVGIPSAPAENARFVSAQENIYPQGT